ncbi:MAG: T9SS type A sorting domain-containing protein [Salibacteraceae bacterium]
MDRKWWSPNGNVNTIVHDSIHDLVYLGGTFSSVGPYRVGGVKFDTLGAPNLQSDTLNGAVRSSIPDGNGGKFIVGDFTKVGAKSKHSIAQLDSTGRVTPLFGNKGFRGSIKDIKKKGDSLFVGGTMSAYGYNKQNLAICDTGTAIMDSNSIDIFSSFSNGSYERVNTIISDGNGGWILGGWFDRAGDRNRVNLAHIKSNGELSALKLEVNGEITALFLDGGKLYVGGFFDQVNNKIQGHLVRVDMSNFVLDAWNPNVNGVVYCIGKHGNNIIIGGDFTKIGSTLRSNIAAISANNALATSWNPSPDGAVRCMVISGNNIVFGGDFQNLGVTSRPHIAKVGLAMGLISGWNANASGVVHSIVKDGNDLYVGGEFSSIGGQTRGKAACIDFGWGTVNTWNPVLNGTVLSMNMVSNKIIIGGKFTTIGTSSGGGTVEKVDRIAAVDKITGLKMSFEIYSSYHVKCIASSGSKLAIGGEISTFNETKVNGVALLSSSTGKLLNWNGSVQNKVNALEIVNDTLFVAGTMQGLSLLALDVNTGGTLNWNSSIFYSLYCLKVLGTDLIYGGNGTIGVSKINRSSKAKTRLSSTNGKVYDIEIIGDQLFFGGEFTEVTGSAVRNNLAKLFLGTYSLSPWNPNVNGVVNKITSYNENVLVGGSFTQVGSTSVDYLGAIDTLTGGLKSWKPMPNYPIYSIEKYGSSLYVGGGFTTIGQIERKNLCAINSNTGELANWNVTSNGSISEMLLADSTLLIQGSFSSIGGISRNKLAMVNTNSQTVTSWNPNPNGIVTAMAMDSSHVYIGGLFTQIGGNSYKRLVKVSRSNGSSINWQPFGSSGFPICHSLALKNDSLFVGGFYSTIGGQSRNNFSVINKNSGSLYNWVANTNDGVRLVKIIDSSIYIGGYFSTVSGVAQKTGARLRVSDGTLSIWNRDTLPESIYGISKVNHLLYEVGIIPKQFGGYNPSISCYNLETENQSIWKPKLKGSQVRAVAKIGGQVAFGGQIAAIDDDLVSNFVVMEPCFLSRIDTVYACGPYLWIDGNVYNSNNYSAQFVKENSMGCDSVITLNLTMKNNTAIDIHNVCDSLIWIDGVTRYANDSTSTFTLTNSFGCDSLVHLNLQVLNDSVMDTKYACDSLTWIDGNIYYASNDTASVVLLNANGCDSVVTLNLEILPDSTIDYQVNCDSLTWLNGVTYHHSVDSVVWVTSNQYGCDSTILLNYQNNSQFRIDSIQVCDSLTWINGITYYGNSSGESVSFTNVNGCDSVIFLELELLSDSVIDSHANCDSLTWINGVTYYQSTDSVFWTTTNINGCDSTVQLKYQLNKNGSVDVIKACDSLTWIDGKTYYSSTDSVTMTFTNSVGCDSLVELDLTIEPTPWRIDSISVCDSLTWIDGQTYYSSNYSASHVLPNLNGCDTIVELFLTVTHIDTSLTVQMNTISSNAMGANFQWMECTNNMKSIIPGENQSSFTASSSGSYSVEITKSGCIDTSNCVNLDNVGIIENSFSESFVIYPNPTRGLLKISFPTELSSLKLTLFSMEGKVIKTINQLSSKNFEIMINGAPGKYILELDSDTEGKSTIVIVKE